MEEMLLTCLLATVLEEFGSINRWEEHLQFMPGANRLSEKERDAVVAMLKVAESKLNP